jgi:hypothetical protein
MEAGMMNDLQDGPYIIDQSYLKEEDVSNLDYPSDFVCVNGVTYQKNLIATMRPIRPFQHNTTKRTMTHIVTFNNPEMKHQFVDEEQAILLKEKLGV